VEYQGKVNVWSARACAEIGPQHVLAGLYMYDDVIGNVNPTGWERDLTRERAKANINMHTI